MFLSTQKFIKFIYLITLIFFVLSIKLLNAKSNLIMITSEYCLYCKIWEKEVGIIYPKTEMSKNFPLKKINVKNKKSLQSLLIENPITPTFIIIEDKLEKGRIIGYSSYEMFWWQIDQILIQ